MEKQNLIRLLKETRPEDIQERMDTLLGRYRELYPEWEIHMFSLKRCDPQTRRCKLAQILEFACRYGPEHEENYENNEKILENLQK